MKRLAVPSLERGGSGYTSEREGSNPLPLHHTAAKTYFASNEPEFMTGQVIVHNIVRDSRERPATF